MYLIYWFKEEPAVQGCLHKLIKGGYNDPSKFMSWKVRETVLRPQLILYVVNPYLVGADAFATALWTLNSFLSSPDSNNRSLPVSVPAIILSSETHAWHRKFCGSIFWKANCFRFPSL